MHIFQQYIIKNFLINIKIAVSLFNSYGYIMIYDINCYNQNQYNQISKKLNIKQYFDAL